MSMNRIVESIRQGFHYALTCRSLWLFGFFVGMTSTGGSGGGGGGGQGNGGGLSFTEFLPFLVIALLATAALVVMRFVSEGALIEGIARARTGSAPTMGEGFRMGWAHWGVLLRIGLLYVAATVGSVLILAAPVAIAWRALGPGAGIALAIPAFLIAVPWVVTLYLVQAFASRIAVLEDRHALDAIRKARLFLHGRLLHGLTLIVSAFAGTVALGFLGAVAIVPVALLVVALLMVLPPAPVIAFAVLALLPAAFVLTAMIGTLRSSIWTVGYLAEVES